MMVTKLIMCQSALTIEKSRHLVGNQEQRDVHGVWEQKQRNRLHLGFGTLWDIDL